MGLEKKLKIKDSVEGKVLTTDSNGSAVSSNVDVNDIASASDLSDLTDRVGITETDISDLDLRMGTAEGDISDLAGRVSDLEDDVEDIADRIININGEEVE